MWIDKAAENANGLHNLFSEFLNKEAFHHIEIVGKAEFCGEEVYVVKATQYVKDIEKTFYFGDYSVGVDMMENSGYVRKNRDILNDVGWYLTVSSNLDKADKAQYKAEAREYQVKKLEENKEFIDEFFGKRATKKPIEKEETL